MRHAALVCALCATASAEPPKLRLDHAPPSLKMRAAQSIPAKPAPKPAAAPAPPPAAPIDLGADAALVRDVDRPVSAQFNLGYVVEGTAIVDHERRFSAPDPASIDQLRAYSLGEGFLSTRGVAVDSLSTYLAARFQLVPQHHVRAPDGTEVPALPPVATWFDRSGIEPRNLWAEVKDFLPDRRFAPLRVRAGEQYVYGPWVVHIYGANAAWEEKLVRANVYVGTRVPDYTLARVSIKDRALISGASVRVDLRDLRHPIPFSFAIEGLSLASIGSATGQASHNAQVEIDWRPRKDVALIAQARTREQELANEHLQLRSRYGQVTNLVFDLTHRHNGDWRWDPTVTETDPLAAKRYLDLGPVLPQLLASMRAGTLIKENIDLYVRGAASSDLASKDPSDPKSTFAASYLELGGALEVRVRRTLAVGASALTRETTRVKPLAPISDTPYTDMLPAQSDPTLGERDMVELGSTLRMNLGARKFSALAEGFARRTDFPLTYCAVTNTSTCNLLATSVPTTDWRWGGRVTVDAWIGQRLRIFAAYELSSALKYQPEITGYKSLQLVMEGIY
ncbi:MAG: hypothetical protein JO257_17910 [Deltaproteobacteria bacterium]|nr:hypothetical protein [Deltaproteobacteria bacterium]